MNLFWFWFPHLYCSNRGNPTTYAGRRRCARCADVDMNATADALLWQASYTYTSLLPVRAHLLRKTALTTKKEGGSGTRFGAGT